MKVLFFTSTRADYSLLYKSLEEAKKNRNIQLQLLVSGSHLEKKYDKTIDLINKDGFKINKKVKFKNKKNSILDTFSQSIPNYSKAIRDLSPDIVIILGDRFESLAFAISSFFIKIPIVHIHGGEVTEGSYDDTFRHMITKLSNLHLTSSNEHRNRVIQLGENPKYVYNVGAFGLEYLKSLKFEYEEISKKYQFDFNKNFFLITYHPVTSGIEKTLVTFKNIVNACLKFKNFNVVITYPNIDENSHKLVKHIENIKNKRVYIFKNLGRLDYPHFLSRCAAIIGNSSSGIIEAPHYKIPTINVGIRQNGRSKPSSIINSKVSLVSLNQSINLALNRNFLKNLEKYKHVYDVKNSSKLLINIILNKKFKYDKKFFDLNI